MGYPTYCKLPVTDCTKEYDKCAAGRHSVSLKLKQEGGVAKEVSAKCVYSWSAFHGSE